MRTFYDYRSGNKSNPMENPVQGRVILKSKKYWLCWVRKDRSWFDKQVLNQGFIVAPRTIYLYDIYIATSFWDALKHFIKVTYKKV